LRLVEQGVRGCFNPSERTSESLTPEQAKRTEESVAACVSAVDEQREWRRRWRHPSRISRLLLLTTASWWARAAKQPGAHQDAVVLVCYIEIIALIGLR